MTRETAAEERRRRQAQSVRPAGPRAVAHSTTAGASYCGDASVHETARIALMNRHAFGFPTMEAPKVLCDVVEALVGAVYVDSGGRLDVVCRVAFRLLHPMVNPRTTSIHPVRRLMVGARGPRAAGSLHAADAMERGAPVRAQHRTL